MNKCFKCGMHRPQCRCWASREAAPLPPKGYGNDGHSDEAMRAYAAAAVAAEREACAQVCDAMRLEWADQPNIAQAERATMIDCAAAIRARSNA